MTADLLIVGLTLGALATALWVVVDWWRWPADADTGDRRRGRARPHRPL